MLAITTQCFLLIECGMYALTFLHSSYFLNFAICCGIANQKVSLTRLSLTRVLARSIVVSQSYADKANKKEKWYGVDYSIEPHDPEMEAKWREPEPNESLRLPEPNAFIPHNFEICKPDPNHTGVPRIIKVCTFTLLGYNR